MKRINEQRPKAFIGTAISVGTSIVNGIIGNRKKKKAEQAERLRQERLQNLQDNQALASAQNENMMSEEERSQFLSQYLSKGGKVRTFPHKRTELRIVEGGTAIPIKKDSFLLKGRKHNTGGIVIDAGKTGVEAEGGEVVQVTPKQLKVFSAQPILNGNSPAELVQRGAKPSKVFNAQESFKDRNSLNDDGTKNNNKMKKGSIRKIYPSLSGRYDGMNEGRAIRSLREARSNPKYQYNSGKNIFSTPSLNSELKPIKREEVIKKEETKAKKQSFSSAFAETRRQGLKIFEWNGKKYGTQLASEVTKKPAPNKTKPKVQTNNAPKINIVTSRIPKMIEDNKFVPGQYPSRNNNVTIPRESTFVSLYKGIKNMLGVPSRKKLGGSSRKDYSSSFAPNALTKANMNSVKTNSVVLGKPIGASINPSTSPLSKIRSGFKNFISGVGGEAISAGIGALGNIISGVTNKNSINNIQAPTRPRTIIPARMRTTYNINPQLAESRDSERNMARIIDSNTSSSSGKIARIQSLANRGVLERNKLRGMKENVETYLLNRYALNRQGVEAANNQVLNAYDNAVTQTENEKIQARANNRTNIIEGLTSAVRDYQLGMDKRRSEENATTAMMSANPEQMELFLKLMDKNKGRLSKVRSSLFRCGGKKKIA